MSVTATEPIAMGSIKKHALLSVQEATPPDTRPSSPGAPREVLNHLQSTISMGNMVASHASRKDSLLLIDGESLDIAGLVAVAKHGCTPGLEKSQKGLERIESSVATLMKKLQDGEHIYGVNTGFGGSADVRTKDWLGLQRGLLQHQHMGILTRRDIGKQSPNAPIEFDSTSMPSSWVRAAMLIRVNTIIRGHSAVSMRVIEALLKMLQEDMTPVIPLRGSISASGDLSPLSYIAGSISGNSDIYVRTGAKHGCRIVPAPEALQTIGLEPVILQPKEGLGLINGTAVSAGVASLALYETNHLATLSQALTAMGVEALDGTAESFSPFIADIRPHRGQKEVASNILRFLTGSHLAKGVIIDDVVQESGLAQDRYALRTASQWVAPYIEDLQLANEQLGIELNSTTDNPLIDVAANVIHHGGNFQATHVTSAIEKTRSAIQMMGKMLFAQVTEMINVSMNKGLPANLAADDPSLSFTCKGIDISMAAYCSELGFLANPVGNHVQSAEMHNQAINSLALISARYTHQAVEVLSLMCAAYLFTVCQAIDLRVLQRLFLQEAYGKATLITGDTLRQLGASDDESVTILKSVWPGIVAAWNQTGICDLAERCEKTAELAVGSLMADANFQRVGQKSSINGFAKVQDWKMKLAAELATTYTEIRGKMFADYLTITPSLVGHTSAKLYKFVRQELNVPFHRGLVEHDVRTIGGWVSDIYEAIREGKTHTLLG